MAQAGLSPPSEADEAGAGCGPRRRSAKSARRGRGRRGERRDSIEDLTKDNG